MLNLVFKKASRAFSEKFSYTYAWHAFISFFWKKKIYNWLSILSKNLKVYGTFYGDIFKQTNTVKSWLIRKLQIEEL